MFEQESYDKATVQAPPQEAELFKKYEIKSWELSPAVYKILAASAVLHIAVITFMAQTNILTMRGCDSPWVGSVCQVVDMAYVGAMLYGTDREFVDEAYENIDLGEAEITYIDVTGETPPISYPEGYFQIANPVQYAMLQQMAQNPDNMAGFPGAYQPRYTPSIPNNDADLLKIRPNPPTADPNAFKDDSSPLFKVEDSPSTARVNRGKGRGGKIRPDSNTNTQQPDETDVADTNTKTEPLPTADPTVPVSTDKFNRKPFMDLADVLLKRQLNDQLNLSAPFMVKARGKLNKDGQLEKKSFGYIEAQGDPQMIKDVQAGIEAFNDSGFLRVLSLLSGQTLELTLQQDEKSLSATVQSQVTSDTRANTLASLLSSMVKAEIARKEQGIAALEKLNDPTKTSELQNDRDDLELLKNVKVEPVKNNLVMTFGVPKQVVQGMIQRKLSEQAAKSKQPNGLAPTTPENNTAIK